MYTRFALRILCLSMLAVSLAACAHTGESADGGAVSKATEPTMEWGPFVITKCDLFIYEEQGDTLYVSMAILKNQASASLGPGTGSSNEHTFKLMQRDGIMPGFHVLSVQRSKIFGHDAVITRIREERTGHLVIYAYMDFINVLMTYGGTDLWAPIFVDNFFAKLRLKSEMQ